MMKIISNVSMKDYTTYKLEGIMKKIYFPDDLLELKELIKKFSKENVRYKILGNGSNLIISPSYDGVFIKLKNFNKIYFDDNIVTVGSGFMLSSLVLECLEKNLSGLEFAYGIPASVGGAICQNAGAYGMAMDRILKSVTVLDEQGNIKVLTKDEVHFNYRDSIFKHKKWICLSVCLELSYDNYENIKRKMDDNLLKRKEKQPLDKFSAGSLFVNPLGYSAGRLIDDAGLKGYRIGDAMVSLKHANFIVNVGHARFEDILKLIKVIQNKVYDKSGIWLELEQEVLE